MNSFFLSHVIAWLLAYKYVVLFPLVALEGPFSTIAAGFLSSLGYLNIISVYIVVVVADLAGDTLYYAVGKWGRGSFLGRFGKFIGFTPERVKTLEHHFYHHTGKTLIVAKFAHGIGGPILAAAGLANVRYRTFLWYNVLGTLPKSLLLLLIGYYSGQVYAEYSRYTHYVTVGTISLLIALGVFFLVRAVSRWLFARDS